MGAVAGDGFVVQSTNNGRSLVKVDVATKAVTPIVTTPLAIVDYCVGGSTVSD